MRTITATSLLSAAILIPVLGIFVYRSAVVKKEEEPSSAVEAGRLPSKRDAARPQSRAKVSATQPPLLNKYEDRSFETSMESTLRSAGVASEAEYKKFVIIFRNATEKMVGYEQEHSTVKVAGNAIVAEIPAYPDFGLQLRRSLITEICDALGEEKAAKLWTDMGDSIERKYDDFGQLDKKIRIIKAPPLALRVYCDLLLPVSGPVNEKLPQRTSMSTMEERGLENGSLDYLAPYLQQITSAR